MQITEGDEKERNFEKLAKQSNAIHDKKVRIWASI